MPAGTVVAAGSLVSPGGQQGIPGPNPVQMPTGTILDFAGSSAPSGFLLCDGSAVSRTTYSALYAVIGSAFGPGDGSTTFNLPDARGRVSVGAGQGTGLSSRAIAATGGEETHQLSIAELASHNHPATQPAHGHTTALPQLGFNIASGGANISIPYAGGSPPWNVNSNNAQPGITVSNTGSDGAHNNMEPFIVFNKIIKT